MLELATVAWGLAAGCYAGSLAVRVKPLRICGSALLVAGWILYSCFVVRRITLAGYVPFSSSFDVLLWFVWWLVPVYAVVEQLTRVSLPGLLVAGLSLGVTWGCLLKLDPALVPVTPLEHSIWFRLAAAVRYTAYAFLAVAVMIEFSSLCFGWLTHHESHAPVERQERYLDFRSYAYRLVLLGFPLLSFAVLSNAFWRSAIRGHYWAWARAETWTLVTWLLFACYLHLRTQLRTSRVLTRLISGAAAVTMLLTFTGVTWLARVIQNRL